MPIPGVVIPNLKRGPEAWRDAVHQWNDPDPSTGKALKDWPQEWYTGMMKDVTGSKRAQRKYIALEYERWVVASQALGMIGMLTAHRFGCDDEAFLTVFPEAKKGIAALLKAIQRQRFERGEATPRASKNGAPSNRICNWCTLASPHPSVLPRPVIVFILYPSIDLFSNFVST
jgi:hypothetical protein